MAKKKKKQAKSKQIDLNQTLMDHLELAVKEVPTPEPESKSEPEKISDDDFDSLLRSFIESEPEEEASAPEDEIDIEPAEEKQATTVRRGLSQLNLGNDENELAQAYANFIDAIDSIAANNEIALPEFFFEPENLVPNYKPSSGRKIVADAMLCWDILFKAYPDKLTALNPSASDEEFLNFAESASDQNLQLAIISYVEILIDIENCELSYEEKRLKAQRRRIERQLYEEYQRRQEIRKKFIEEITKKRFPVDAERLVNNYFKTAAKDVEGAFKALTTNPAVYAPIEISKIKPRFFGLVKVSPKDGIRENHRLGEFLKKLKV